MSAQRTPPAAHLRAASPRETMHVAPRVYERAAFGIEEGATARAVIAAAADGGEEGPENAVYAYEMLKLAFSEYRMLAFLGLAR